MKADGLSIIIPTYNETPNINILIKRLTRVMESTGVAYEIIFIDDHSTDKTLEKISFYLQKYPIQFYLKQGKCGKGYSIMEGFKYANYEFVAMLDADLQYPLEIIPNLLLEARKYGFAVANRKTYQNNLIRKIASRINAFVFGRLLLNLKIDVQSGLKIFRQEIFEHMNPYLVSSWGIDMPLVFTAFELGYKAGHIDFDFHSRKYNKSIVTIIKKTWEIATGAVKTRLFEHIHHLPGFNLKSMTGSGIAYKRKRFITHTTLNYHNSALMTISLWQKIFFITLIAFITIGIVHHVHTTVVIIVSILSTIYFIDVIFNAFVILKSLHFTPEIIIDDEKLNKLKEKNLPKYSILCPLYHEARVLPYFIKAMTHLDWPKNKLEVLLLLEEDDLSTINAAKSLHLPFYFKIIIVPDSEPKTKPKACNYGLGFVKGKYLVIYDAEDRPDSQQLKKAYLAFLEIPKNIICLQAKLNYYNPHHNFLTRFFTAEYSLWFDVVLPGLQSFNTAIPLGGTSNHFRFSDLLKLCGWDPFNVTEDCDLGIRLFKAGYKTAIIDSTTYEEANSKVSNWLRQRSRWIKGYMQTYLVHMRNPFQFFKKHGIHALIFQLVVGGKIGFILINPILWVVTILYFTLYTVVGPAIESVYPTGVFYMAVFSLFFGNFIYLFNYMIGCVKHEHWDLVKYVFLVPIYWLMISYSALNAIFQLIFKPHYWEKTIHGFYLENEEIKKMQEIMNINSAAKRAKRMQKLVDFLNIEWVSGGILILSSFVGNFANFLYNFYLGRKVSLETFGIISLIGSFIYISQIFLGALYRTTIHKSAFLLGKYKTPVKEFWQNTRKKSLFVSIVITLIWLVIASWIKSFFRLDSLVPILLFTPVWVIGTLAAVDGGFLGGYLRFKIIAVLEVSEAVSKLLFSIFLVEKGYGDYVYAAIPLSMAVSFAISWYYASKTKVTAIAKDKLFDVLNFPKNFFITSIFTSLTGVAYLSLDVILVKHFLQPVEAGAYSFLSLAGKMVFFLSSLVSQFTIPLVSRNIGAGKKSENLFTKILLLVAGINLIAFIVFGIFGYITAPFLWGTNANTIIPYLPTYTLAMVCYSISSLFITYYQIQGKYLFSIVGFILGLVQILGIYIFHADIYQISFVVAVSSVISVCGIIFLRIFYNESIIIYRNIIDLFGLFRKLPVSKKLSKHKLRILIFNWRDIRHVWAGGAEVYIHELSKRWVRMGHQVMVFCGNDGHSLRHEKIDGVNIIRRGGFYFVYIWAFLYYQFRLKGSYDIIIDSENGLPFFMPLYAKEKIFLLIHHVHQEVFRKSLMPPFSWIAMFLENKFMPFVYKNVQVITVSPSSKDDILDYHLTNIEPKIIYNGVDKQKYKPGLKSNDPLVIYIGRLKSYKSLYIFIQAAQEVLNKIPNVKFIIAGNGEESNKLKKYVNKIGLKNHIKFLGKITEDLKISLYQKAWVFVNPSLIEGWGITTIEANACGTPVVASNVAGLCDSVSNPHSGLLVPYGNVTEFVSKIEQLIKDKNIRKQMSKKAVIWSKNFDWDKSARKAISIFSTY